MTIFPRLSNTSVYTSIEDNILCPISEDGTQRVFAGVAIITSPLIPVNDEDNTYSHSTTTIEVVDGAFSAHLVPNDAFTPSGTVYAVTFQSTVGDIWTETWLVPTSDTPVTIRAIRTELFPLPEMLISEAQVSNLVNDLGHKEATANKGQAGGYASLDDTGKVPVDQIPTLTDISLGYTAEDVANKDQAGGYPSLDNTGKIPVSEVPALDYQAPLTFTPEDTAHKGQANGYASLDGSAKIPTGQIPALSYQAPLGFTAENVAHKGQANGYASLDGSAKIPTGQIPSLSYQTPLGFTAENVAHKDQANGYPSLDGSGKVPTSEIPALPYQAPIGFTPEDASKKGQANGYPSLDSSSKIPTAQIPALSYQTPLGFAPENTANKGVASGYASLDSSGKVPTGQLPSFQTPLGYTPENVAHKDQANGYPSLDSGGKVPVAEIPSLSYEAPLGFTPEDSANKGQANGYPSLDSGGKVPVAEIPSLSYEAPLGFTPENTVNKAQPSGYASLDSGGKVPVGQIPSLSYQSPLGFTPENSANKGVASGYASLDGSSKVPVAQIPSLSYQAPLGYTAEDSAHKGQASGYASLDSSSKVPVAQIPALSYQAPLGFTPEDSAHKGQASGYASLDSSTKVPVAQIPALTYQAPLGFTPEDSAHKGQASGYASLDSSSKVPVAQIPALSYQTPLVAGTDYYKPGDTTKVAIADHAAGDYSTKITSGSYSINVSGSSASCTGNAATATNGVVTTGSYSDPSWLTLTKAKVGLGNVENTALSTWAGTSNITTTGTLGSLTVNGTSTLAATSGYAIVNSNLLVGLTSPDTGTDLISAAKSTNGGALALKVRNSHAGGWAMFKISSDNNDWQLGAGGSSTSEAGQLYFWNSVLGAKFLVMANTGKVNIGNGTAPTHTLQISTDDAYKTTTGTWAYGSDSRLKQSVQPFTDGLSVVRNLNPVQYRYNGLGGTKAGEAGIGIVADDVQHQIPYAVGTHKVKLHDTDTDDTDILTFNPHSLFFVLLNAVKELDETKKAVSNDAQMQVPNKPYRSNELSNGSVGIWLDEQNNALVLQTKYSTGVVKSASISLT